MIKRYKFDDSDCADQTTDDCWAGMEDDPDGEFVKFSDHEAALATARAETWTKAIEIATAPEPHGPKGDGYRIMRTRSQIIHALEAAATAKEGE
jgi:hypothetical protein